MSEVLDKIKSRRSIRKYKPDEVPRELLDRIAEAGIYAASGRNIQSPIVIAVTDRETRDRLSRANASVMGSDRDPFYGAPAVLIVLADKSCPTHTYDGSLVMGNMMLAAHELGLGSCWIHRARETFEMPEWKEWLKSLGIEGDYEGIGNCIVGYPDCDLPEPAERRENRVYHV